MWSVEQEGEWEIERCGVLFDFFVTIRHEFGKMLPLKNTSRLGMQRLLLSYRIPLV